jgi:hypothetical protein
MTGDVNRNGVWNDVWTRAFARSRLAVIALPSMRRKQLICGAIVALGLLPGIVFLLLPAAAPPQRAFYYWKTQWSGSPETLDSIRKNRINRLYVRFFDVRWDDGSNAPYPVAPLELQSPLPSNVEIVPVVYLVNAVFLRLESKDVAELADKVWRKVSGMAELEGIPFRQLQLDCDWSDSSRQNYFRFIELLSRKLEGQGRIVSSTIRLHQIKYAARTGIPPVSRGMLMFYNFNRIQADSPTSSIFNGEDAERYSSYISRYPLELDVVLPMFSWSVHSRDGQVLGLLEGLGSDETRSFDGFRELSSRKYIAKRSFFFRGRYFAEGDLLVVEETTPEITMQAADLARRGAGWRKRYDTIALFDLDDRHLQKYSTAAIGSILDAF